MPVPSTLTSAAHHDFELEVVQGSWPADLGGSVLFFIPLLVFAPVLSMRLLAEERHTGTLETLLTAPITTLTVPASRPAARSPTAIYSRITGTTSGLALPPILTSSAISPATAHNCFPHVPISTGTGCGGSGYGART